MRLAFALAVAFASLPVFAVDGVVLINQANALAGNVTPGDAAGFPVTISQSGSYKLSSNLVITDPNATGIRVTADNVTIDLNGFSIIGPSVCNGQSNTPTTSCTISNTQGIGIDATEQSGISIMNGTIRGMSFLALVCFQDAHIEGIHAIHNASGIQANGVIIHNVMNYNLFVGLSGSGIIEGNEANGNKIGFLSDFNSGGVVKDNVANFNSDTGFFGQSSSTVLNGNSARGNANAQILAACPGSVTGNSGTLTFNGSSSTCVVANNSN